MKLVCVCGYEMPVELRGSYLPRAEEVKCLNCHKTYMVTIYGA